MEVKEETLPVGPRALKDRFLAVERRLRVMELERIDFVQSMRMVLRASASILQYRGFNDDLVDNLKNLEMRLGTETGYLELVEQAVKAITKLNGGRGSAAVAWSFGEGAILSDPKETHLKEAIGSLAEQLEKFKHNRYQHCGQTLKYLIETGASLENFLPVLVDLSLRFLRDYGNEMSKISFRLTSIIKTLIFTESEYAKFLDRSIEYFERNNRVFNDELSADLTEIKTVCTGAVLLTEPDSLLGIIADKIDGLFSAIQKKNLNDEHKLGELNIEKEKLANSLEIVRRDYDSFVSQSHSALHELEAIKRISLRDPLTSVYNRRAYDEQIMLTVANFNNGFLSAFGFIIFDIDNFREVNNTYGHLAGDSILSHMARLIKETLRNDDFIFRYGGDEFVIILPEAKLNDTINVADKLRRQVELMDFYLSKTSDKTIHVTISVGVSQAVKGDTAISVLTRADQALYKSKEQGRNRVSIGG
ncbi:MAG: GGDEF domain-containing protein [Deltaproteobacteria bacterium]|nr:GGDEF domain-containing protein [Deltaproteobacteria bacterium]